MLIREILAGLFGAAVVQLLIYYVQRRRRTAISDLPIATMPRIRPLAFNLEMDRILSPKIQITLGIAPLSLMFLMFVPLCFFMFWIADLLEIPPEAPIVDQQNGLIWMVMFFSVFIILSIFGYSVGWLLNVCICRFWLGWSGAEIKSTFMYSRVPDRWLRQHPTPSR